jgi:hypothetical protein
VVKSRGIKWEQYVACMINSYILVGNLNGRGHLGDLGVDGSIILRGIVKKQGMGM